jgi:hypothetical protein
MTDDQPEPFDVDSAGDCEPEVDPGWLQDFERALNEAIDDEDAFDTLF